jgi:chromosome partitioning protein
VTTIGPQVLAVISTKGGTGKSTAAGYACSTLAERGLRVLGVDADKRQATLMHWWKAINPPWDCIELPRNDLDASLPGIVGDRYDAVVIDTPPTEYGEQIALSAARAATHVLVPVSPSSADFAALALTRELLDRAVEQGAEFEHGLMLVKWKASAGSGPFYTQRGIREGWNVLRPHADSWEIYIQAVGNPIVRASSTGYGWAVAELMGLED